MATVTVNINYGMDMRGFDFSSIYDAYSYTYGSTIFRASYGDGWLDEFRGTGFKYNSYGEPVSGTVTGYALVYNSTKVLSVDGGSVAVTSIVKAAGTYSTKDDLAIVSSVLKGNDKITGGNGADYLTGFAGNDTIIANKGDDVLKGGTGDDKLYGGAGKDKLYGEDGNDRLYGGLEKDFLHGGAGKDTFVFDTKLGSTNIDTIDDFSVKDDTIWLDDDIFTKAGKVGDLASGAFYVGTKAHDSSDRIIYDSKSGKLWYDADGNGKGAATQFAQLDAGLKLTAADFDIIG